MKKRRYAGSTVFPSQFSAARSAYWQTACRGIIRGDTFPGNSGCRQSVVSQEAPPQG